MLTMFSENAAKRNLTSEVYEGFWPAVSTNIPIADVVTCHNVVYNVQEIVPFLKALDEHARKELLLKCQFIIP